MLARSGRRLTVEQFLHVYDGVEGRYELVNGEVWAMSGGSVSHATVAGNIFAVLHPGLRGTGYRPFNSDMGLMLADDTLRYPDVAVYCDPRDLDRDPRQTQAFRHPKLIFEVLSPSTADDDRGLKVAQYKTLSSLSAIILVDPLTRRIELHQRVSANEWRHLLLEPDSGIALDDPPIVLEAAQVFVNG